MTQFHQLTMTSITGDAVDFSTYDGKLCLIVNVASA
jgi:glutathione peroxidase-family protein